MNDPSLVLLLGSRMAGLAEKIERIVAEYDQADARRTRVLPIAADLPQGFLRDARAADIYYALVESASAAMPTSANGGEDAPASESEEEFPQDRTDEVAQYEQQIRMIVDAASDLLTQRNTGAVSRLSVILVGSASCPVTLGLWLPLARTVRERLRQRLAGLAANLRIDYIGMVTMPLEATATELWRDVDRYAWLREALSCTWFRFLFFLSRASADLDGEGRSVLTEDEADDLTAAAIHAVTHTGFVETQPTPLLRTPPNILVASSMGLYFVDLPIKRIRRRAAGMTAAEVIAAYLARRRFVSLDETKQTLVQAQLDGAGLLNRLLLTTRPGENLVNQLILPTLEYNQVQEIGELPDRLRSYSTWLGQQRVSRIADRVDANLDPLVKTLPQDLHTQTASRTDAGPGTCPEYGRNFLTAAWDLNETILRQANESSTLESLARTYENGELADQVAGPVVTDTELEGAYSTLANAIRNRVVPIAAYLRFGLLGFLTALLTLVRLLPQFGPWVASAVAVMFLASGILTAFLTCLQSQRRIRRRRDDYMRSIINYHRGNLFRYVVEQLRTVLQTLQRTIGDPANLTAKEYATSERRILEDAADALAMRASAYRTRLARYGTLFINDAEDLIDLFPTYRYRQQEDVYPDAILSDLLSVTPIGWLPGPDDSLMDTVDRATNRIFDFCDAGFEYLNEISLLSILRSPASSASLARIWGKITSIACYYHPSLPMPGYHSIWYLGLSGTTVQEIRRVLSVPSAWCPSAIDLPVSVPNRLVAMNLGWNLNISGNTLLQYWRRAYQAEDAAFLHPAVDDISQLPDPLSADDEDQGSQRLLDIPPAPPETLV